jgi:chloramphenicol 3-O phosphotransferase
VFEGFHRCLPALLDAGNNLIVDDIIETPQMWTQFRTLLRGHDVFLVGLHCLPAELERREQARGDRRVGDAARDLLNRSLLHALSPGTGVQCVSGAQRRQGESGLEPAVRCRTLTGPPPRPSCASRRDTP